MSPEHVELIDYALAQAALYAVVPVLFLCFVLGILAVKK